MQEPIAIIYQSALRKIGVELELKKVPAGSLYNFVTDRKQPMIFYVDSPWCPDPGYSLTLYFDSKSYVNYSNYANADVDKLLAEMAATADETVRLAKAKEAQKKAAQADEEAGSLLQERDSHGDRKTDNQA